MSRRPSTVAAPRARALRRPHGLGARGVEARSLEAQGLGARVRGLGRRARRLRPPALGLRRLLPLLLAAFTAPACDGGGGRGAAARPTATAAAPRQVIILVDRSASRQPHMLAEGKRFIADIVNTLTYGDEIVLIEMHQGSATEDVRRWSASIPALEDPAFESIRDEQRRSGVRQGAMAVVEEFFEGDARAANTDILSTLQVAAEYVRDAGGRRTILLILSDMLQSANGIEMERQRRMPEPGWLEAQRVAGLLPALDGVCVAVIGADATTPDGAAVKRFWQDYFTAVGARLSDGNYRIVPPGAGAIGCS